MNKYILGLWLGDGFIAKDYVRADKSIYYRMCLVCSEFNYEEAKNEFTNSFTYNKKQSKDGKYKYYEIGTKCQDKIKEYLPYGMKSENKVFPTLSTESEFFEVLSGLIDSDGAVGDDNMRFYNTNTSLINGVAEWLDKLNISYTRSVRKAKEEQRKDLEVITFSQSTIGKVKVNLRVSYKSEKLAKLQSKSKGGYTIVSQEFINEHFDDLSNYYKKAQLYRLKSGKVNRILTKIYKELTVK